MRKLVTIRKVDAVNPIPEADAIECLTIEGWKVVSQKGNFQPGDLAVYFEIDSTLPDGNPLWQDLVDKSSRMYDGKKVHVLRTIRLRGQVSQGFAIPLSKFGPEFALAMNDAVANITDDYPGAVIAALRQHDFSEMLGVTKYEPPVPAELAGLVKGMFPSFIRKTDQERIQNLPEMLDNLDAEYEVTVKLDGSSMTVYRFNGEVGVCSRNLDLQICDGNKDNTLVKLATVTGLLENLPEGYAVQGELMGPSVQGNRENLKEHRFYVFDIFDINAGSYVSPERRAELFNVIATDLRIQHVPIMHPKLKLRDLPTAALDGTVSLDAILEFAEGPSINHAIREGLVFKRADGKVSFKAIANKFLLKQKE